MGFSAKGVFLCEEVSSIEYKGGLFYLSDECGDITLRRAMRPETFVRCVLGAYDIAKKWEADSAHAISNVVQMRRA